MNSQFELYNNSTLCFSTPDGNSYKFGYYNYSPISKNKKYLLAHKIPFEGRMPNPDDVVEIGYFDMETGEWFKIADSCAFNWQQGSMLQWLGPDFNSKLVFNDVLEGRYIARIIDIQTLAETIIPKAIYSITPDGKISISLNFERCDFTRAYSYNSITNEIWNLPVPDFDGIIKIDLDTGKYETIINLREFLLQDYFIINENEKHWFEHIMLNPSGSRFSFYHRFGSENNFSTRSLTADLYGDNIWLHPNKDTERLSHLGWMDDEYYVLYTIGQSKISQKWIGKPNEKKSSPWYVQLYRKLLKPLVPRKVINVLPEAEKFYALTNDQESIINKINPWPRNMDGHPSFTHDKKFMLTDTYSDKEGFRHLIIHNIRTNKSYRLGKFYSIYNNCGWRTDLHPRFSPDESQVIIDSNHNGKTTIMVINIDWKVLKG